MKTLNEEVRALVDNEKLPRKEVARLVGNVSGGLLSQWSTGKERINEQHLAKLVELVVEGPDNAKETELLRLFLLLLEERLGRGSGFEEKAELDPDTNDLSRRAKDLARRALGHALSLTVARKPIIKSSGRTLCDFPDSFQPLAIISGDKREEQESRITRGDFGAVSASHAELRWLCKLGLPTDVEVYGDKVFVLEKADQLKERFGKTHLLIVGSPGSNHLARRCLLQKRPEGWRSAAPVFRFNLPQYFFQKIETLLESLSGLRGPQLAGKRADDNTSRDMKEWLHNLFQGGILDPTNKGHWLRGTHPAYDRDYGLITLARNPLSEKGEPFTCIMVAGFHLLGTAHALKMLTDAQEMFKRHPVGGVIRVSIDLGLEFAKRFDESTVKWDDEGGYRIDELQERLREMQADLPPTLHTTKEEVGECLAFMNEL